MRINPIQSVQARQFCVTQNNKLTTRPEMETETALPSIADNYGKAIVFGGIKETVMKAPFEDKLAVGLSELKNSQGAGNYLIAAKTKQVILESLNFIDIPVPVRKLVLLIDPNIKDTLLLAKNGETTTLINTNENPIVSSDLDILHTGDSIDIRNGDHFKISQGWFEIKNNPSSNVVKENSDLFMTVYDYEEKLEGLAFKHNQEVIRALKKEGKPVKARPELSFESIGGQDEVIYSLQKNIIFPLKHPEVFENFMLSRGAILYGKPGTGKTLLAKALAAESGASVFELCATDLANKYVGESEKNCRELFQTAVDAQPSIIYIDEIDALGKARGADMYGDKLLTQFLSLMSDLEKNGDQVFVIGSTNRKEDLDSAFTRSGRFSTLLEVKAPDLKGTRQILDIHTNRKPLDKDVDKESISAKMYAKGMTGADIAATVKEAFSNALERTGIYKSMVQGRFSPAMQDYLTINTEDFTKAIDNFNINSKQRNPVGYNK